MRRLLTERQRYVIELVAEGLSDKEVAARLKISRHWVIQCVSDIKKRLGISGASRVELANTWRCNQCQKEM